MGAGGSGGAAGGGGYSGGGLANTGGTGYGGNVGAQGTAGEMSGGAGGAAMAGFGNTAAGGSGMAGISTHSGMTPAGFTPAYGDPRGASIGMDAYGNYKGTPGYAGVGAPGKPTTMTPKAQMDMFGYVLPTAPPPTKTVSAPAPAPAPTPSSPPPGNVTNVGYADAGIRYRGGYPGVNFAAKGNLQGGSSRTGGVNTTNVGQNNLGNPLGHMGGTPGIGGKNATGSQRF